MVKKSDTRFRNFATVVYPESAPVEWFNILSDMLIPCFVSPLHDKDINPGGEIKKPHYHVVVMFEGKKSIEQVTDLFSSFGGVGCEKVNSIRGYARYLVHLDNPEKAQYSISDVRALCGADYSDVINLPSDDLNTIREMLDFISLNSIYAYCDFLDYCAQFKDDWFRVLCRSGTYVIKEYLKTKYWADHNLLDEERFNG